MMGERGTTRKGATSRETSIEREKKEMKLKGRVRADDKKEKGKKKKSKWAGFVCRYRVV